MSVSSVNSDDVARLAFDQGQGGYGLRGIHGRHGERQREAVQSILPLLKQQLRVPGALAKSDRENVKLALKTASEQGKQCWGPGHVYKKKEYVENAILNLYFQSVCCIIAQWLRVDPGDLKQHEKSIKEMNIYHFLCATI